jgi:hypothetical protein
MAHADGELDSTTASDVARAAETDPALAKRLDEFRRTRVLAKEAYADILKEQVPSRLSAAARRRGKVSARWWDWRVPVLPAGVALAASIAALALVLTVMKPAPTSPLLPSQTEIALVLDRTLSGQRIALAAGRVMEPIATYVTPEGACRSFRVIGGSPDAVSWLGVACRHADIWQVEMAVAEGVPASANFAPASNRAIQSIDTFLDAAAAGESQIGQAEERLLRNGWRTGP